MISGTILLKKIKNGKHRENLRSETYSVAAKGKKNDKEISDTAKEAERKIEK